MLLNSIISLIGGKKALRNLIYERMPESYDRYIEVFGGAGWVLFGKGKEPQKCMEIYNDFNSNLANLFFCVKQQPIGFLPLNSRDEFSVLRKFLDKEEFTSEYLEEELNLAQKYLEDIEFEQLKQIFTENAQIRDLKRATTFFKLIKYSYGSSCRSFGCKPFDIRKTYFLIWEANRRLANTLIENKDFEALIRQYDRPNAFFIVIHHTFKQRGIMRFYLKQMTI